MTIFQKKNPIPFFSPLKATIEAVDPSSLASEALISFTGQVNPFKTNTRYGEEDGLVGLTFPNHVAAEMLHMEEERSLEFNLNIW